MDKKKQRKISIQNPSLQAESTEQSTPQLQTVHRLGCDRRNGSEGQTFPLLRTYHPLGTCTLATPCSGKIQHHSASLETTVVGLYVMETCVVETSRCPDLPLVDMTLMLKWKSLFFPLSAGWCFNSQNITQPAPQSKPSPWFCFKC